MVKATQHLTLPAATLWGDSLPVTALTSRKRNPCVALYGPGPEGKHCGDCQGVPVRCWQSIRFKCALRSRRRGVNSDHGATWPACEKFRERGREP